MNQLRHDWHIDGRAVQVWHAAVDDHRQALHRYRQFLTVGEDQQAQRLRFSDGQAQSVVTRGLLRFLLGKYLDRPPHTLNFVHNPYGKPDLADPPGGAELKFNVSHSHGQVLLAFARGRELGVDLEFRREISDFSGLAERFFAVEERAELAAIPPPLRRHEFFNLWTLKEAFIKARGLGLSLPLDSFHIVRRSADRNPLVCQVVTHDRPDEGRRWSLAPLDISPGFAGAIAAAGHDWAVDYRECSLDFVRLAGLDEP